MKTKILLFALVFISFGQLYAQNETKYSSDQIKEDLDYLYSTLQKTHYNLFVNTPKKEYQKAYNVLRKSITDSLDLLNVYRQFQPFVALSKLAHCATDYPFEELYDLSFTLFPLNVHIDKKTAYISGNYSKNDSIIRGMELLSINNVPIEDVIAKIYTYFSGENDYLKNTLLDLFTFNRMLWAIEQTPEKYTVVVKDNHGQIHEYILKPITVEDFENEISEETQFLQSEREFKVIENIAYIKPGPFLNLNSDFDNLDIASLEKGEFMYFIDSVFTEIKKIGLNNLIIDLRNNGGGSNTFSDELLAYFADKPFKFCSKFEVKTSQITKDFWVQVEDSNLIDLKEQILNHKNGDVFISEIPFHNTKPDSLRFHGNVYVLINRYSYSQATVTAAMVQDYGFGILIGETTADIPTTYGSIHQFKLPNTNITISYPKGFVVRPNGDDTFHGVVPEFIVDENIFTKRDEILEYTLNLIREGN